MRSAAALSLVGLLALLLWPGLWSLPPVVAQVPAKGVASHGPALTSVGINAEEAAFEEEVQPISGRLEVSVTDLAVQAGPVQLDVRRSLLPRPGFAGLLGTHWRLNWERHLTLAGPYAMIADGADSLVFTQNPMGGAFRTTSGDVLVVKDGKGIRTRGDGVREIYDLSGRLSEEDHGNGVRVTLVYGTRGRLEGVEGPYQHWLRFRYENDGRLWGIDASNGTAAHYSFDDKPLPPEAGKGTVIGYKYDAARRLEKTTHSANGETVYGYDAAGRIESRKWADGLRERFDRNADGTVRHTDASGLTTTLTLGKDGRLEVTDGAGGKSAIEFDAVGRVAKLTGPTGRAMAVKYDALGRVETMTEPQGVTRYEYVGDTHRLAAHTAPGEPRQTFHYSPSGYLAEVRTATDTVLQMTYYPDGLVKSVKGPGVTDRRFAYDVAGRLAIEADALGNRMQYRYDRRGNLWQVENARGETYSWSYDEFNRLRTETDPDGRVIEWKYGAGGRLASVTEAGGVTALEYDAAGRLFKLTDPMKLVQEYSYDGEGRLRGTKFSDGRTETYEYTGPHLTALKDSAGADWKFGYDAAGRLASEDGPHGHKLAFTYHADGQLRDTKDALGRTTIYTYDAAGWLETVTEPGGRVTRMEYDAAGRLKATEDSLKRRDTIQYDDYGRVTAVSRAAGEFLKFDYSDGWLAKVTGPAGESVAYTRDAAGRVKTRTHGTGESETFTLDALGRVETATDALKRTWKAAHSRPGRLAAVTVPGEKVYRYQYGTNGELEQILDPRGFRRTLGYDALGRQISETDALGRKTTVRYDAEGRIAAVISPDGRETKREYDLLGRLKKIAYPEGPADVFGYDAVGNRTSEERGDWKAAYKYDELDRLTEAAYQPSGQTLKYTYDAAGRRKTLEVVGVGTWTYGYGDRDWLTELKDPQGRVTKFAHDEAGRVTEQTLPNGVTVKRAYDNRGRLTSLAARAAGDKVLLDRGYEYDLGGNLKKETREGGKELAYEYDAEDRLTAVKGIGDAETFAYDAVGNRMLPNDKSEYDAADQVKRFGEEAFTFNPSGHMTGRERGGQKAEYVYDAAGQLVAVKQGGATVAEYGYDPRGRRVWKKVGGKTTHYVHDGLHTLLELDDAKKPVRVWTHTPELDRPVGFVQGDAVRFPLADAVGSVLAMTSDDGTVTGSWDYRPFGELRAAAKGGLGKDSPAGFAGREFDPETGLYNFRARHYDPVLGRFLTPDPEFGELGEPGTLHAYQYALNNPFRYVDPLGLAPVPLPVGLEPGTSLHHYSSRGNISSILDSRRLNFGNQPHTRGEVHFTETGPGRGRPGGLGTPRGLDASIRVRASDLAQQGYVLVPGRQPGSWIVQQQPGQAAVQLPPTTGSGGGYLPRGGGGSGGGGGGGDGGGSGRRGPNRRGSTIFPTSPGALALTGLGAGMLWMSYQTQRMQGQSAGQAALNTGGSAVVGTVVVGGISYGVKRGFLWLVKRGLIGAAGAAAGPYVAGGLLAAWLAKGIWDTGKEFLEVSRNPVVPPLRGMTLSEAANALGETFVLAGAEIGPPADPKKGEKFGRIAEQVPPAGAHQPKGTPVVVALYGPAEETEDLLDLPDVKGKTAEVAAGILVEAGFKPRLRPSDDRPPKKEDGEKVQKQEPAGGAEKKARQGSEVVVSVYGAYTPSVPIVTIDNLTDGQTVSHKVPLKVNVSAKDANGGLLKLKLTAVGEPLEGGTYEKIIEFPETTPDKPRPDSGTQVFTIPMSNKELAEKKTITLTATAYNGDEKWTEPPASITVKAGGKEPDLIIEHTPESPALREDVTVTVTALNCEKGTVLTVNVSGTDTYYRSHSLTVGEDGKVTVPVPGAGKPFTTDTVTASIEGKEVKRVSTYRFSGVAKKK